MFSIIIPLLIRRFVAVGIVQSNYIIHPLNIFCYNNLKTHSSFSTSNNSIICYLKTHIRPYSARTKSIVNGFPLFGIYLRIVLRRSPLHWLLWFSFYVGQRSYSLPAYTNGKEQATSDYFVTPLNLQLVDIYYIEKNTAFVCLYMHHKGNVFNLRYHLQSEESRAYRFYGDAKNTPPTNFGQLNLNKNTQRLLGTSSKRQTIWKIVMFVFLLIFIVQNFDWSQTICYFQMTKHNSGSNLNAQE